MDQLYGFIKIWLSENESLANWLSAIATFAAVAVSLYLSNKSIKPKIEVIATDVNTSEYKTQTEEEPEEVSEKCDGIEIVILSLNETPGLLKDCSIVKKSYKVWKIPSLKKEKEDFNIFFYNKYDNEIEQEVNFVKPIVRVIHKKEILDSVGSIEDISCVKIVFTDFKGRRYQSKNLKKSLMKFEES